MIQQRAGKNGHSRILGRWQSRKLQESVSPSRQLCWQPRPVGVELLEEDDEKSLSRVWLFATPWTVAHWAPWSMGFSRHEYWSGLPFPAPGDLPDPGIEAGSPAL